MSFIVYFYCNFLANKYQEARCQSEIKALQLCCEKWSDDSGVCKGIKPSDSSKKINVSSVYIY